MKQPTKMSPGQFCKFARLFPHLGFADLAAMVKDECLPEPAEVAKAARAIADNMTPSEHNLAAHAFLHELAAAADEQAGKAVAS